MSPRQKRPTNSVQQDVLEALRLRGVESNLLDARLEYMELEGTRRYVAAMSGQARVFPSILPTQASGRWSTTEPPLVNFPAAIRDVVGPDPDEWCLSFDFDSVEARLFMGYAGDEEDLATVRAGHDIHTLTACMIYDLPLPRDPRDPHTGEATETWRAQVQWKGEKDPRRQVAKSLRYAVLQYGTNEHAASNIRDIEKLGMTRTELYARARKLLHSKPRYMAWKLQTWGEAIEEGVSRTFLGRKRRLFPTTREKIQWRERRVPGEAAREGLNHRIQGATTDIMNGCLIAITQEFPESRLFVNRHDGAEIGFPETVHPSVVLPRVTPLIAKVWMIGGTLVPLTASGSVLWPDGRKEAVKFEVVA